MFFPFIEKIHYFANVGQSVGRLYMLSAVLRFKPFLNSLSVFKLCANVYWPWLGQVNFNSKKQRQKGFLIYPCMSNIVAGYNTWNTKDIPRCRFQDFKYIVLQFIFYNYIVNIIYPGSHARSVQIDQIHNIDTVCLYCMVEQCTLAIRWFE